jgi:hypothetical protein
VAFKVATPQMEGQVGFTGVGRDVIGAQIEGVVGTVGYCMN